MTGIRNGFKVMPATLLPKKRRSFFLMPEQYEGPVWLLVEYKGNNKHVGEKVPKPEVSRLPRDYDAIASDCFEGAPTGKCSSSHCEAMCIPRCNLSEGNQSRRSTTITERCGPMPCQFRVGVPTIFLRYYDAPPGPPSRRDFHSRSCISTQYVPL